MNKKINMVLLGILVVSSLMVSTASAVHPMMAAPTSNTGVESCEGCHNGVGGGGFVCTDCHVYPTFSLSVKATPTSVPALSSSDVTLTVGKINTVRESGYNGLTSVFSPANGASVSLSGAGVSTSGTTDAAGIVTKSVNPTGAGTIDVTAALTGFNSGTTTVSVTPASPSNTAPVADDQAVTTPEGTPVSVTLTASDADGDMLTYAVASNPTHGTLSGTAPSLTYTPDAGYNGTDSFTFTASDGTVDSNIATVSLTVTPVSPSNTAPVADDQAVTTPEGTPVSVDLTATDADGNTLTYAVVSNPMHGTLSGTAPALTYTPDAGYNGTDSFTFKTNDGTVDSNIATVSITVTPATSSNPPPTGDDEDEDHVGDHEENGHHDGDHEEDGHHDGDHEEDGHHDGNHEENGHHDGDHEKDQKGNKD